MKRRKYLPSEVLPCPHEHELAELNVYAEQRRYEEGPTPATTEDGLEAQQMALEVLAWSETFIP